MVVEEEGAIKNLISNFYKSFFTTTAGSRMEELMMQIPPKVSEEMKNSCRCFISAPTSKFILRV